MKGRGQYNMATHHEPASEVIAISVLNSLKMLNYYQPGTYSHMSGHFCST